MLCTFWGRKAGSGPFAGLQLPQAYRGVHPGAGRPASPLGSDSRLFFSQKQPLRSLIFTDPASSAFAEVLHLQVVASWLLITASN